MKKYYVIKDLENNVYYNRMGSVFRPEVKLAYFLETLEEAESVILRITKGIYAIETIYINK